MPDEVRAARQRMRLADERAARARQVEADRRRLVEMGERVAAEIARQRREREERRRAPP